MNEELSKTLSVCMIAKNEESFIKNSLLSVLDIADEIIVVDTGSTDKTQEIAREAGAKVIDFKWEDSFSAARNESIRHSGGDWILVIDADEIISSDDKKKIKGIINSAGKEIAGFAFEQRSYLNTLSEGAIKNNSLFEPAVNYPYFISNFLVRLFRNNLGIQFRHRVHELVEESIEEKGMKREKAGIILHHFGSLKDETEIANKAVQYSRLIFKQLEDNPESARYNYQAGRMFLGQGNFSSALKYFERTAEINPEYKSIHSEIAKVHLYLKEYDKAIKFFIKSLELGFSLSSANNLAVAYMSKGDFESAKKLLENYINEYPDNDALKHNYNESLKNLNKTA